MIYSYRLSKLLRSFGCHILLHCCSILIKGLDICEALQLALVLHLFAPTARERESEPTIGSLFNK